MYKQVSPGASVRDVKRALLALSLLVLGATVWWAMRPVTPPGITPTTAVDDRGVPLPPGITVAPKGTPEHDAGADPGPLPTLKGEVRDDTGGIAQARVEADLRGTTTETGCESHARTASVAGGTFDFGALCPGQYDVRATRGARVATAVARLARGTDHPPLYLLLREGTRLTVRVRDQGKAALPGVEVRVQDSQSGYLANAVTADDGLAVVDGLLPRQHSVWGKKPGYLDGSVHDRTLSAGADQVDLQLLAGVRFEGRVVDPEGAGIDGVWLRVSTRRKELGGGYDTVESDSSSDGGEFSIGPLRPGAYFVVATHDSWQRLEQPVRVPTPRVTLKMGRGATVDGMFLDADGAPLAAGDIHAALENEADSRNAEVDEWGRFKLEGLGRGQWAVIGLTKSADGGPQGIAVSQLGVKNEQPLRVTLQLRRGARITGRCVAADGSKGDTDVIAIDQHLFKRLRLSGFDPTRVPPGSVALSTCSDTFALEGLEPGRYALLACGNDEEPAYANAGDRDVTVSCREGMLKFRVVDPARRPVEKFAIGTGDWPPEDFPGGRFERPLRGETDEVLTIRAPGFAPLQRRLVGKRGQSLDLGDLQLQPARRLSGRVLSAKDNQPVSGAELRFGVDHGDSMHRARSAADGRFELVDVARENGKLFVSHPSYRSQAVQVGATQDQVTVTLAAGLELSGAVITRDGREPRGYQVEARGPDGSTRSANVTDGRYTLGSLEPGDWKLRLNGPDVSGFDPLTITLIGSGAVSADFVERLGGVSFGVLPLDDEGHPIVAWVWLVPGRRTLPATLSEASAFAIGNGIASEGDPSGAHSFSSVAPGPYTAVVQVKEYRELMFAEAFEVNPGMASPLRLSMPRSLEPLK